MKPKLIIGLSRLQKEEWTSYRRYILMYTREGSDKFRCFKLLQKHKEKFDQFDFSKWHKKYMPEHSEKIVTNTFSKLFGWYEDWMVYNSFKKDKVRSGIELVKLYNRNGEYKLADSMSKQIQALLDENDKYNPEYDYYQYRLYYYQFYSDNPIKENEPDLIIRLINSYLKFINYNSSLFNVQLNHWKNIKPLDTKVYTKMSAQLGSANTDSLMGHLLKLLKSNDLNSFHFCFTYLESEKIDKSSDFFTLLTFYLVYAAQNIWYLQKSSDSSILVNTILFALNNDVFFKNGKMSFKRFLMIIRTIGPFQSFEWTNDFINKWTPKVAIEDPESTQEFAMANNYFQHGKFGLAAESLQKMNTSFINSRIIIHQLAVKVYYDTRKENLDLLYISMDRYESYLKRRKTNYSSANYKIETNFLKAVKLLINKRLDSKTFEQLLPVKNSKWLMAKLKEANPN